MITIQAGFLRSPFPSTHRATLNHLKMGDSVWALHDFSPENEDELAFRAGDEITVVEKDDLYGDGWWQVKGTPSFLLEVHLS